jgi:hypothetical protein
MMRSTTHHLSISTARADALFVSALQRSEEPSVTQIREAIAAAIREFGARGCAARVAQAYGEHPETAAPRMRWARAMVTEDGIVKRDREADGASARRWSEPAPAAMVGQRIVPGACCAA